jgi:hypothetical protein
LPTFSRTPGASLMLLRKRNEPTDRAYAPISEHAVSRSFV